jgi:hypothetical protein
MSYLENNVAIISSVELKELLRTIIKEEMKKLEERLKKPSRILNREQAAEMLGVSPNTISSYIKRALVPNHGQGRKILILEDELLNTAAMHKRFNYSSN